MKYLIWTVILKTDIKLQDYFNLKGNILGLFFNQLLQC
jgi:hypothetical protein